MKIVVRSRTVIYLAGGVLFLALLACGLPGSGGGPTPTLFVLPTVAEATQAAPSTQAPAPTEQAATQESSGGPTPVYVGNAGPGDPLDLCKLPTPEEVQAVLGGPPTRTVWAEGGQDCDFFVGEITDPDVKLFIVQAGHDADGKTLHLGGMEAQRDRITDPAMLQLMDEIKAQEASLTLPQLVEKALPVWRAAGFTAEKEPGIGDWAVWFYGNQAGLGNLAELGAGRASGAWVAVYMNTSDEESAKPILRPLAAALLDRLPDNFTLTGTSTP